MNIEDLAGHIEDLEAIGTEPSIQAAAALEAVLISLAASPDTASGFSDLHPDVAELYELLKYVMRELKFLSEMGGDTENPQYEQNKSAFKKATGEVAYALNEAKLKIKGDFNASYRALVGHQISATPVNKLLTKLTSVASYLDGIGKTAAADYIDLLALVENRPAEYDRWKTREDLYDHAKHNKDLMWKITKQEVDENRKEHHLTTMRDHPVSLSTRYSPEYPGVQMYPVSDGVYQDIVSKKIYNYHDGWTDSRGNKYPSSSVANQTPNFNQISNPHRIFDTRVELSKRKGA